MFCLSWNMHATRNTSHDTLPHFHTYVVSFQKSLLQSCGVPRRIWCLLSAPVSRLCWNRKCDATHGDKHSCCATPNVHTATPLGILSGNVPCSQVQRTHSHTAIGWCSMELVSKLFDTPTYLSFLCFCPRLLDMRQYCPKVKGQDIFKRGSLYNTKWRCSRLGCDALYLGKYFLMFWGIIVPSSWGSKQSKKFILLGLLQPDDEGTMILQNTGI